MAENNKPPVGAAQRKDAAASPAAQVKGPFCDLAKWGTKPPEARSSSRPPMATRSRATSRS